MSEFRYHNHGRAYEDVITELEARISELEERDEALRHKFPALQDAYEQYLTVKRLVLTDG